MIVKFHCTVQNTTYYTYRKLNTSRDRHVILAGGRDLSSNVWRNHCEKIVPNVVPSCPIDVIVCPCRTAWSEARVGPTRRTWSTASVTSPSCQTCCWLGTTSSWLQQHRYRGYLLNFCVRYWEYLLKFGVRYRTYLQYYWCFTEQ